MTSKGFISMVLLHLSNNMRLPGQMTFARKFMQDFFNQTVGPFSSARALGIIGQESGRCDEGRNPDDLCVHLEIVAPSILQHGSLLTNSLILEDLGYGNKR